MNDKPVFGPKPYFPHQQELLDHFKALVEKNSIVMMAPRQGMSMSASVMTGERLSGGLDGLADTAFLCGAGSKSQTGLSLLLYKLRNLGPQVEITTYDNLSRDYSALEERVLSRLPSRMEGKRGQIRYLEYIGRQPVVSKLAKVMGFAKPSCVSNIDVLESSIRLASMQATDFKATVAKWSFNPYTYLPRF